MSANIDKALANAKANLLDATLEACAAYARRRVRDGAGVDQVNAELGEYLPKVEAIRKQGVARMEEVTARYRQRRDVVRFAGIAMRVAFCLLNEAKDGERPRIEQIDPVLQEDHRAVALWLYDTRGESYLVTVPISQAEAESFSWRSWKELVRPLCDAEPEEAA